MAQAFGRWNAVIPSGCEQALAFVDFYRV
jgi:hypothetical protein